MSIRFRVWHIPQIPMQAFRREVGSFETAHVLEGALAAYDLFEFENRVKPDYANVGGVEFWDDTEGEWSDVDTETSFELKYFIEEYGSGLTDADRAYMLRLIEADR